MAKLLIAFALIFVFGVLSGCAVTVRRYHQKPHRSLDEIIGGSVITLPDRIWIGNTIPDDMQICVEPDGLNKLHGPGCRSLGELRRWVNELQARLDVRGPQ